MYRFFFWRVLLGRTGTVEGGAGGGWTGALHEEHRAAAGTHAAQAQDPDKDGLDRSVGAWLLLVCGVCIGGVGRRGGCC